MGLATVFIFVGIIVYILKRHWRILKTGFQIDGPPFIPFIGNVHLITQFNPNDFYRLTAKLRKTYGKTFRLWIGPKLWVFLHSPEEVRAVLNDPSMERSDTYHALKDFTGNGIVTCTKKEWFPQRRALRPHLLSNDLSKFRKEIYKHSKCFTEIVLKKGHIEDWDTIFRCFLDIFADNYFAKELRCQQEKDTPYVRSLHEVIEVLFKRVLNPFLAFDFVYRRTTSYKKVCEGKKLFHTLIDESIHEQYENLNSSGPKTEKYVRTLLYSILTNIVGNNIPSLEEIRDGFSSLLLGGMDTASATLCFSFYSLAKYPEWQDKILQEIPTDSSEYFDIDSMHSLDIFIKECMRLYTTVPLIGRQAAKDLKIGNLNISRGTTLWINLYALLHDEEYFPDPDRFDPERFAKPHSSIPNYVYIPFGGGSHHCIGRKYAMVIIKTIITTVLINSCIKLKNTNEDLELTADISLKIRKGFNLIFERR